MATRETVLKRADLAASFQSWVTKPGQNLDLFDVFNIPSDEDMITIPATLDESAVVTMHRMERTGASVVVLLTFTQSDRRHRAIPFHLGGSKLSQSTASLDVPELPVEPGMTVRDWVDRIDALGGAAHTTATDQQIFTNLSDQMNYDISA